jgi:CheY-like chemotaxis protein
LEGLRVLVIEDEAIIAMTAEDMLEELGCTLAGTAASLGDALAAAEGEGFDLALPTST